MDQKVLFPILTAGFVVLMIARRVARNIGRQPLRPGYMQFRIGLLSLIGVLFAIAALRDISLFGALAAGAAAGAVLGWFGLQHTKFEATAEGKFYTPHTYIGLAVSALLIARLAYRFLTVYPAMQTAAHDDQNPFAAFQRSPLTLAIFGVLIGYYVFYYVGVLRASRNLSATEPSILS
jgi:hypothetical protein